VRQKWDKKVLVGGRKGGKMLYCDPSGIDTLKVKEVMLSILVTK
jgi:hypothetical protein